jgi:exopolyphosphatase/guanosine-5'-triphosphate,3'-diphosphate pyrophosphatase
MGMTQPTLRWEWRAFGQRFGEAEHRLTRSAPSATQESDELYLLSSHGDNVKVRDGLMDVKVLREVDGDGLERWAPVMKERFPLSAFDVAGVLEALRCPVPPVPDGAYPLEAFLETFAGPESGIRLVPVHKKRVRYTIDGCMAELSDIVAEGKTTRTLALECEDPACVSRAVEALGLGGYANTSFPKLLGVLAKDETVRFAVIDVGTNSVKLHVADRGAAGGWTPVADRAVVTRLGEGLAATGRIGAAPLARTAAAVAAMAGEARQKGASAVAAVGTAALRTAVNRAEALAAIREKAGIEVGILSGEEEARLAYLATVAGLGSATGTRVVFDTGGGSSQFTFGDGDAVTDRFSLPVGAARYAERFGLDKAVGAETVEAALAEMASDFAHLDGRAPPDAVVGMGGAATNLAAVALSLAPYDPEIVRGATVEAAEIDRQIALYRAIGAEARRAIVGLQPERAELILAGACIVRTILAKLGASSFSVSDRGLRHGFIAERFGL